MKIILKSPDIFGNAVSDFYKHHHAEAIAVFSEDFEDDRIPVSYLFRNYPEMPPLEQKALQLARGKILDVGCCAGSHALYLQNERKLAVKAIDLSEGAIAVTKLRGVQQAAVQDFFQLSGEKFDTLLLLMNGAGIIGKMKNMSLFFEQIKQILQPDGQVLLDSSDLKYLYDDGEEDNFLANPDQHYYGELTYQIGYKGQRSHSFDWLYIDFKSLQSAAEMHGFSCQKVKDGSNFDYLALLQFS